jgi:hypothetical protein
MRIALDEDWDYPPNPLPDEGQEIVSDFEDFDPRVAKRIAESATAAQQTKAARRAGEWSGFESEDTPAILTQFATKLAESDCFIMVWRPITVRTPFGGTSVETHKVPRIPIASDNDGNHFWLCPDGSIDAVGYANPVWSFLMVSGVVQSDWSDREDLNRRLRDHLIHYWSRVQTELPRLAASD